MAPLEEPQHLPWGRRKQKLVPLQAVRGMRHPAALSKLSVFFMDLHHVHHQSGRQAGSHPLGWVLVQCFGETLAVCLPWGWGGPAGTGRYGLNGCFPQNSCVGALTPNVRVLSCHCCVAAQSCPTLCDPMNCSPPGSSVHGILQARTLEGVAMPSSRGPSRPRDRTQASCVSCFGRQVLYH